MDCECGRPARKLFFCSERKKWLCGECFGAPSVKSLGHTKVMVGNKHYPKMSYAMQQRIVTRRVRSDGKIRPDVNWR